MQGWMWSQSASKDFLCVAFSTVNVNVGLSQMFIRIPLWHPKWSYLDICFTMFHMFNGDDAKMARPAGRPPSLCLRCTWMTESVSSWRSPTKAFET
jgi:hypothetical protein